MSLLSHSYENSFICQQKMTYNTINITDESLKVSLFSFFFMKKWFCFAGMGLELGINLFMYGGEVFHKPIIHLLGVAYDLLEREPYIDILQVPICFVGLYMF